MSEKTVPQTTVDLSHKGVDNILAALATAGLEVHYNETDGDTALDVWLTDLDADNPMVLSWRATEGWLLKSWATSDTSMRPAQDWSIVGVSGPTELAGMVAGLIDDGEMTPTTDTKAFPGFAPGEARALLADVHRWARTNGWTWNEAWNWIDALYASDATIGVDWDTDTRTVTVRRNDGNGIFRPTTYPADSIRQAVDVLVTYGVLPAQFSSAVAPVVRLCDDYKDQPPPIFRGPGLSEHGKGYNAGTRDLAWAVLTVLAGEESEDGAR